jgi:hypothetical protein
LALGAKERRKALGDSGMKLLDNAPDPIDLRRNRTLLTPKGPTMLAKILAQAEKLQT